MQSMQRSESWPAERPARELSLELRHGRGEFLRNRRRVAALSLLSLGAMGVISLYQMGIIRHLPEPDLPLLDADKVDAADEAYAKLGTPDAVLGLVSYAATAALAAMGGQDRARTTPWIPVALAAKAAVDAVQAGKLTWDQWAKQRAFCSYCLVASAATFAAAPLVVPEARAAIARLRS